MTFQNSIIQNQWIKLITGLDALPTINPITTADKQITHVRLSIPEKLNNRKETRRN